MILLLSSLFATYFPSPTGDNGLEEYVRAADVVASPAFRPYVQYATGRGDPDEAPTVRVSVPRSVPIEGETPAEVQQRLRRDLTVIEGQRGKWSNYLAYCADVTERFGGVLDLIRTGNAKPSIRTADLKGADRPLENVVNVALAASHLRFAQGRSSEAVAILLNQFTFLDNLERNESLIGAPANGRSAVLSSFARHMGELSLLDCASVQTAVSTLLARPAASREAAMWRREGSEKGLREDVASVISPTYDLTQRYASPFSPSLITKLRAMTPDERTHALDDGLSRAISSVAQTDASLDGPEKDWVRTDGRIADPAAKWDDLGAYFADRGRFDAYSTLSVEIAYRTRLRLLDLSARVRAYEFKNGRLPKKLAGLGKLPDDPASGKPFVYKVDERGFEVSSVGLAGREPIFLDPRTTGQSM